MKHPTALRIISTLAFALMIIVNAMANALPINGLTTGEVSDLYPSLFTPAGITFSIWGVIYLTLLVFVIYIWTDNAEHLAVSMLPGFILTCILNASWILVWHYLLPELSVLIIIALLSTLTFLFLKSMPLKKKIRTRLAVVIPFTIYLAWICVATIANISALLVHWNWDGFGLALEGWTIVMILVAAALALLMTFKFQVPEFSLIISWALIGIYLRSQDANAASLHYVAAGAATVLFLIFVVQLLMTTRS